MKLFKNRNKQLIADLIKENNLLVSIISTKLSANSSQFSLITNNQNSIMKTLADLQADLTALQQSVAAEDTVIDSAVTLISGFGAMIADLKQQLADALANQDQDAMQQVVANMEQLKLDVDAKAQTLAGAVSANTTADTSGNANTSSGSGANTGDQSSSSGGDNTNTGDQSSTTGAGNTTDDSQG